MALSDPPVMQRYQRAISLRVDVVRRLLRKWCVKLADRRMYVAKKRGRTEIVCCS